VGTSEGEVKGTGEKLRGSVDKLQSSIDSLERSLKNVETTTDHLAKGDGTIGRLVNDPAIANNIEEITKVVVAAVSKIQLGPVHLIDGGDGQALPRFAATYPAAGATVMHTLAQTTGVDITSLLAVNAASAVPLLAGPTGSPPPAPSSAGTPAVEAAP